MDTLLNPVAYPGLAFYIAPFIFCCLVVAAGVEVAKRTVWLQLERANAPKPKWLRHAWRLLAVAIGAASGLIGGLTTSPLTWYEGFAVGCGAGVLSTSVIAVLQRLLERKASKESS